MALGESRWLVGAVCCQIVWSAIVCPLAGLSVFAGLLDAYGTLLGAATVFGAIALAIQVFRRRVAQTESVGTLEAYARAWSAFRLEVVTPEYLANVALTLAIAPLALSAFSAAKQAIPVVHPFSWDAWIAKTDLVLAGGKTLAQRLQAVFGRPEVTQWMDWYYHRLWTLLLLSLFAVSAVSPASPLRRRFLLSFVLVFFLVGNVLALLWSSAGPPYYSTLISTSADPYATLFAYLRSVNAHMPLLSLQGQQVLWSVYRRRIEGFGFGVSAMPSVHVASATIVALFGFAKARWLGLALSAATLLTLIGSIVLGWHYPLDGYVGIVLALLIWWLAGRATQGRN